VSQVSSDRAALRERLTGVLTALVTPMRGGEVDFPAFERHLERQLAGGVRGLVPVGTTGEAATLSPEETDEVIRHTVRVAAGHAFVLAGVGTNATRATIDKARRAADLGVDGLLVVTPYYNKPSQAGLYDHFAAVAAAVKLPAVLYSVPGRTGVELGVETCARLARDCPTIVGLKEAGGRCERITELRLACPPGFIIHSGDDGLTLPFLALGADGVISVASNLLPREIVALVAAWRNGDPAGARVWHERLYDIMRTLFIETNPTPIKAALAERGWMAVDVRRPAWWPAWPPFGPACRKSDRDRYRPGA
jgi:4-hydroxy-tetrahydrodipicolinate synthase